MKVTISVAANHLKNVAGVAKGVSDPFAVLTALPLTPQDGTPLIIGKTEVIKNTLDPDWTATFNLDFELGKPKNILVKIFDEVRKGDNKSMGSAVFEVGDVLGSKGSIKAKHIKGGKGVITLKIEQFKDYGSLRLKMSGVKLKNFDGLFNKSDPFFEIRKKNASSKTSIWDVVHRSSYIKDDLNPNWELESLPLSIICDGNLDEILKVTIYDHESSGKHELMGEFDTSVNGLVAAKKSNGFEMKRKGKTTGKIVVHVAEIVGADSGNDDVPIQAMSNVKISPSAPIIPVPVSTSKATFVDYIKGGCEINLSLAIDFTGE